MCDMLTDPGEGVWSFDHIIIDVPGPVGSSASVHSPLLVLK